MTMWLPSAGILDGSTGQAQQLLIAQFWHELLSPSSPDTYRAKALDLPLLLEELLRIVPYAQQEPKWINHVHLICEEIASYIPLNSKIMVVSPVAEASLTTISRFKGTQQDLPRLKEQVQIFQSLQSGYVPGLLAAAMTLAGDSGNKKLLSTAMKGLATHVQMQGGAEESLAKVTDTLCSSSPEDVIAQLCGDVNLGIREFTCYVAISASRPIASAVFSGDQFQECGAAKFSTGSIAEDWYAARPEGIVVEIGATATSRLKAAESALAQVLNLNHLHVLYANSSNLAAIPRVLVQDGAEFHVVEVTPSRHFGLEPRRESAMLTRLRYTSLRGRLGGRLGNLLESHALAVSANDARSAVFHLWTALETLASGLGSETIGQRVANVVAPIVAWRRVDKVVTYLAISAHELRTVTGDAFDLTHMPRSNAKHIDRSDVLAALSGPNNNAGILAAFASCAKSPLLKYRLYRAWEELSDPRTLKKVLELSHSRIKWQTMRFYRARNLLVHYGEIDNLALRLLENAQYYLSTCVGRVLHDMTMQPSWDINTSLEFHRQKFESLQRRLQESPREIEMGEVFVHSKSDVASIKIWPAPSE